MTDMPVGNTTQQGQPWPRLGAFSYDFADLDSLCAAFKQQGLSAVQLGSPLLDQVLAKPEIIAEVRGKLEENGIQVVALAGYCNPVAPDEGRRRRNIEFLKRCLEAAPLLGVPVVATETGTRHEESDWIAVPENQGEEARAQLHSVIEELLAVAEEHGAILALEGYVNNVVATLDDMTAVLERFPSRQLQVVLDPYNYLSRALLPQSEEVVNDFLQRFKQRFALAHLKDVSDRGAEVNTPEFGLGVFPQHIYLDFLRTQRPDLPLVLEHLPWEHMPAAIERVRRI